MRKIPFTKYTCFGNNFVIVDETRGPVLSEREKMKFAHRATDGIFGVGSDNFLEIDMVRQVEITKFRQSDGARFFGDAK